MLTGVRATTLGFGAEYNFAASASLPVPLEVGRFGRDFVIGISCYICNSPIGISPLARQRAKAEVISLAAKG
jgi:hypothetical protein